MKKLYIILLLLLATFSVSAQQMPSVAGVTFGWSYEQCKQVLDTKFNGGESSYQLTPNELEYYHVKIGGHYFFSAKFSFQNDGRRTYLNHISFLSFYELNKTNEALSFKNALLKTYRMKYNYRWEGENKDGFTYYVLGENPLKPENGFIVIDSSYRKNISGETKIWVIVDYGSIDFVKPEDEI